MASNYPVHNPFGDDDNNEQSQQYEEYYGEYGEENAEVTLDMDQNNYGQETETSNSGAGGGFTMSDNRADQIPQQTQNAPGLVINKPTSLQSDVAPAPKQNTLRAHTNPFANRRAPPLPSQMPVRQPPMRQPLPQVQTPVMQHQDSEESIPVIPNSPREPPMHPQRNSNKPRPIPPQPQMAQPAAVQQHTGYDQQKHINNPFGAAVEQPKPQQFEQQEVDPNDPFANDPPLLEDLDIDMAKIKYKFVAILTQRGFKENDIAQYNDMAGPILVAVLFGAALLLKGRVEFGNIYGFGLTGCIGIYFIINLMSRRDQYVDLYACISILGYGLLPFCILAFTSIFCELKGTLGMVLSSLMVFWSTLTATRLFEYGLDMEDKKYLIAYPIVLFYSVFMLLTIF